MLETGSPLPELELEDTAGQPVHLADQATLIYFTRSPSCPVCNKHVQDLIRSHDDFAKQGVQVFVAVPADREEAAAWKEKRRVPFPVLVGRHGSPHASIGLTRRMFGSMQQSGSVLVDARGIVRHAHAATLPTGAYDKKGITEAIRAHL